MDALAEFPQTLLNFPSFLSFFFLFFFLTKKQVKVQKPDPTVAFC